MTLETRSPDPGEITGQVTLLLIEGSAEDAVAIKAAIESGDADLSIETVEHISEGLERVVSQDVDVALLDLSSFGNAGPAYLEQILEAAGDMPVIALTTGDDKGLGLKAVKAGAQDFLLKEGIDRQQVLRATRYAIERKRAERALRASEERYRHLFEHAPIGIFRTTPDGSILMSNPALVKLLGYRNFEDLARHNLEREGWGFNNPRALFREMIEATGEVKGLETEWRRSDGVVIYVRENAVLVRDDDGRVLYYEGTVEDITERRRAEEALRDSEGRYRSVIASMEEGIVVQDANGFVLECNASAERILGVPADQIIGNAPNDSRWRSVHVDMTPFPMELHPAMATLRSGQPSIDVTLGLAKGNGPLIWLRVNSQPLFRAGEDRPYAVVSSFSDISERRRVEHELKSSSEQLRALSAHLQSVREAERTRIAREIHDELGQSLTALKMEIAWLEKRLQATEPDLAALKTKTRSVAELLDETIQSVREIATELRPSVLDTVGLTAAIEWQIQEFQTRTNIACQARLAPIPEWIDPERSTAIFRIFQEILTNIARHASATRVKINLDTQDGSLVLQVRDNGLGIDEREITRSQSLGLLGMSERAHLLDGEVKIKGFQKQGTLVAVRIPLGSPPGD
jgi:PAS domain S-box-containing protein